MIITKYHHIRVLNVISKLMSVIFKDQVKVASEKFECPLQWTKENSWDP